MTPKTPKIKVVGKTEAIKDGPALVPTKEKKTMLSKEEMAKRRAENAKGALNLYFAKNEIGDFSKVPTYAKLTQLQRTPGMYVKARKIKAGGRDIEIPYVEHQYAEKALNYVFNFNISTEILEQKLESRTETVDVWIDGQKTKKTRTVHNATVTVRFKFFDQHTNREIVRDVISGHKGYENPATTEADVLKSAVSKAWTAVARPFGIGADISGKENKGYRKVEEAEERPTNAPVNKPDIVEAPVEKTFTGAPAKPNF